MKRGLDLIDVILLCIIVTVIIAMCVLTRKQFYKSVEFVQDVTYTDTQPYGENEYGDSEGSAW